MGRAVVGDEGLEAAVDAIASAGRAVSVGLLIGRLGVATRDLILGLVPSPLKEDGTDPAHLVATGKQASGSKPRSAPASALSVDFEWVAEHARQVSRMLLGGTVVAGIYCLAPEPVFKQSTSILSQVVKFVLLASCSSNVPIEGLMLHIASSPRRISCRACCLESNGHLSLNPCEWRTAKIIPSLQTFTCSFSFDVSIPVPAENDGDTLKSRVISWTWSEFKMIQAADVLIDNSMDPTNLDTSQEAHDVQLLLPLSRSVTWHAGSVSGTLNLRGAVHARAYGFSREPASNAIAALKEDIIASLRNRIELFCEEKEQSSENSDKVHPLVSKSGQGEESFTCILPRRVMVPWNGFLVCDYLLPSESLKDTEERFRDLFGEDISEGSFEPEEFWNPEPPSEGPSSMQSSGPVQQNKLTSLSGALFAAVMAILVALVVLFIRK